MPVPRPEPKEALADGRIADNIVYFARALRKAGMRVGPASVKDAIEAVLAAGIGSRDDFYWTLHAVLVSRREDHPVFDDAFRLFWKSRELIEKLLAMFSPVAPDDREKQKPRAAENRVSQAMFEGHRKNQPVREVPEIEVDARLTFSGNEVLRGKDFAQMDAAEMAEAKKAIAALRLPFDLVRTRRFRADAQGGRIDPRAMMRSAARTGGELILPKFRSPREAHPPLVVLADISGSMSQYTRIFLHFLHALTEKRRRVHAFVFGTRLTNLTRQMRHRDPDEALAECSTAVKDWSGGTRIGDTLAEFNRLWSRRVLGQGAVVLLITDGLERDDVAGLSQEMERLQKSCRRLIWLNPLLRFDGFEARARGVKAMLPYVDEFRAVHNLDALADLCASLDQRRAASVDPRRWRQAGGRQAA
ncbi:VWA domain-containing protein [Mesorhizobium sp. CA18]|uniref:vWA domain-containing protein n=1 Tax=unclassified Mesorhizobium TaxID=325217 RepID=UPI001CCC57F6|nr:MULTISPECIES: VWA domain-containing protein [unclassified Mesorhizobium]MBZ9733948.1 VWA domain-containing protein [Mesorhizobium sp. CA9]MBZ9825622.1 VWA domain-containing protein [Mesorhizobium sp. CA18]MBZ9832046.1 VWA domain-containing protein [Mesorhizobium sp. CA2]MBZ9837046.1 VWA domain-containing protein [Mesorhizobium sp. CA3]MBZ9875047.1 VWA domain-containing protein [Mesorhizobium sp. Ca11]